MSKSFKIHLTIHNFLSSQYHFVFNVFHKHDWTDALKNQQYHFVSSYQEGNKENNNKTYPCKILPRNLRQAIGSEPFLEL